MNKFYVLIGAVVVAAILLGMGQAKLNRVPVVPHKVAEAQVPKNLLDLGGYDRGFMEGMNATLKHIQFNTNNGKFTLDIADVLAEMKTPTNSAAKP